MEMGPADSPRSKAKPAALAKPDDMLLELSYPLEKAKFFDQVEAAQREIECIVRWHLKLRDTETPRAASRDLWLLGNFNVNIPVYIDNWCRAPRRRILVRIPLPYKLAEARFHGNVDEKLRCEVATFIWLLDRHPTVPVPFLWGFGFRTGSCVRVIEALSPQDLTMTSFRLWTELMMSTQLESRVKEEILISHRINQLPTIGMITSLTSAPVT